MTTHLLARGGRPGKRGLFAAALGSFLAIFILVNALLACLQLPDYGGWTGIRPLETKLRMLEDFSSRGEVDALALGSSIADFGFSAELFSHLMSKHLGREYRAFNFATGGAEPRTYPKLYRLARMVSKPRNVFVLAPPEQKLAEKFGGNGPDHFIEMAPVGPVLDRPLLLASSRAFWQTPIFRYAPAVRDLFLYRSYRNLQTQVGMDGYRLSDHGDRVSHTFTWKPDALLDTKVGNERVVQTFPEALAQGPDPLRRMLEFYFAKTDIDAMTELRNLVERDGGRIYLIAHAGSASLWGGPSRSAAYVKARQNFYRAFASQLNAPLWNVVDAPVSIPFYGVADTTHLNAYGADIYTRLAFAVGTDQLASVAAELNGVRMDTPRLEQLPASDTTFNVLSAIVQRPAGQANPLLKIRLVDAPLAVPPLPKGLPLFAGLRMPSGEDVVVPAFPIGPSDFVAEVNLPPSPRAQNLVLRLMYQIAGGKNEALGNPLADYEWLDSYPRTTVTQPPPPGPLKVLALPPERVRGEPLYIALKHGTPAPAEVSLRLESVAAAQGAQALDLGRKPGGTAFLKASVPEHMAPGWYEVRVYDAQGGAPLGRSRPLEILAAARVHELAKIAVEGRPNLVQALVEVSWSGISNPSPRDWIGLFPVGGDAGSRMDIAFTRGSRAGRMKFPIPSRLLPTLASGRYEFRLYAADGWRMMAQSAPIAFASSVAVGGDLGLPRISVQVPPDPAKAAVEVSWSGIPNPSPRDWIGLFPVGGAESSRMDIIFTRGGAEGRMDFVIASQLLPALATGKYEFRLYAADSWRMLAQSPPIVFASSAPAASK